MLANRGNCVPYIPKLPACETAHLETLAVATDAMAALGALMRALIVRVCVVFGIGNDSYSAAYNGFRSYVTHGALKLDFLSDRT